LFERIFTIVETYWEKAEPFFRNPVAYVRPIIFNLLSEMISALADGIVNHIKEIWGDEK